MQSVCPPKVFILDRSECQSWRSLNYSFNYQLNFYQYIFIHRQELFERKYESLHTTVHL